MGLLAFKAIWGDRSKLITVLVGVAFAMVLINLQAGLLLGLLRKASILVDHGNADIWVGHQHMDNADIGGFIPERWVERLRGISEVERADAYIVMFGRATLPNGRVEMVAIVGCDPASLTGNAWSMAQGDARAIRGPNAVLVDALDVRKLGNVRVGDTIEINGRRAKIAGLTDGIVGFTTNPFVFTTLERARRDYTVGIPVGYCSYFLVKAKPGTDVDALCRKIRERVPELDVYSRDRFGMSCMKYWLTRTGIGMSFGLAALLGLLVGVAVVAQTLYGSVTERLREFATLKALGASEGSLLYFLMAQASGLAITGAVLGLLSSWLLACLLSTPRAAIILTWEAAAASTLIVVGVCLLAAWLPYRRLRAVDPASILRS